MPATSSAPGSKPQSAPKPKKVKRVKPTSSPPTSAATRAAAAANAQAVAKAEDAAAHAVKVVKRAKRQEKALKQMKVIAQRAEHESRFAKAAAKEARAASKRSPEYKAAVRRAKETTGGSTTLGLTGKPSKHVAAATDTTMQALGEIGTTALPIPAFTTAQKFLRGAKLLRTATRAEEAAVAARAAKAVRGAKAAKRVKTAEGALAKSRATGKGLSERAAARLSKVERKARRAKHIDQAVASVANPTLAAAAVNPGEVGKRTRALVEGTVTADPKKALATTARAIPATLAYGATVATDLVHAAATGDTGPLEGAVKEGGKAFKALEPLVSGDPEKVRKATESKVGYVFTPLLPRGAVSTPARALGRGASKVVRKVTPKGRIPEGAVQPGRARVAKQVATGGRTRKRVAKPFARETQAALYAGARAAKEIDKPARKIKGARGFKNLHGVEAGDLVPVIARYGISRKNPSAQLERVVRSLDPKDAGEITTVRKVAEYARQHPEVLADKNLWKSVDAAKRRLSEVETSTRAKYLAQGRVLSDPEHPILKPEERVPARARPLTKAKTRGEAWADLEKRARVIAKTKYEARVALASGQRERGLALREKVKGLEADRRALHKELKGYTKGDRPPSILQKRKQWDQRLVDEFADEVRKAAKEQGFEEPSWVAERTLPAEGQMGGPRLPASGTKATHIKTGKAELTDVADRSLRNLQASSVYAPRMQAALHRVISRFTTEEAIPKVIGGRERRVITGDEAAQLIREKKLDPREEVLLPARQWKKALEGEEFASGFFDVDELYSDVNKRLKADIRQMEDAPGTKYVIVKREAAREFADQVNPNSGAMEKFLSATGMAGTRVILGLSPAWMLAQVMAEGLQTVAAVSNPARLARSVHALHQLKKTDPRGYEAFAGAAGESVASFDTPHSLRVEMDGGTQRNFADAGRAIRRTAAGRALYAASTIKALGMFDRWKGGKYRSIIAAAHADKEFNQFLGGLQGMLRQQDAIANKLKGKPLHEQLSWLSRNPKALERHLDYLDDVMGNWSAFSRFERQFAPALIFYPFLRMSMRWTFWSYPLRHPVKAQMLYLLAQQNSNDLEKLLGVKPSFLQLAQPVLHGENGKVSGVMPGGTRFAAPGSNVITQAIGENNISGLARALNPLLGLGYTAISGKDPMTGEESDIPRAMLILNQLLSTAAPARAAGLNRFGKSDNPVSDRFAELDPNRSLRSLVDPFIGLSAESARKQAKLSQTIDQAGQFDSEVGQFIKLVEAKGLAEAKRIVREDMKASDKLRKLSGKSDPEIEKIISAYYKVKYPSAGSTSSSTSGGGGWYSDSTHDASTSSASKGGWYR